MCHVMTYYFVCAAKIKIFHVSTKQFGYLFFIFIIKLLQCAKIFFEQIFFIFVHST